MSLEILCVFFFFFKQKTAYEMLRSLVGSEMWIRDRSRTARSGWLACGPCPTGGEQDDNGGQRQPSVGMSASPKGIGRRTGTNHSLTSMLKWQAANGVVSKNRYYTRSPALVACPPPILPPPRHTSSGAQRCGGGTLFSRAAANRSEGASRTTVTRRGRAAPGCGPPPAASSVRHRTEA